MEDNPFARTPADDDAPEPTTSHRRWRKGCLLSALVGLGILVVVSIFQPWLPLLAIWYLIFLPENLSQQTVDVPQIRGRIVELQTGTPVAGVEITRDARKWALPDLESHNSAPVAGAKQTTWSSGNGGFVFYPLWRVRGLQTMSWTLYKEGWMPSGLTVSWDRTTRSFDCSQGVISDPWLRFTCRQLPWEGDLELEIRISRPTYEGVKIPIYSLAEGKHVLREPEPEKDPDPWSEYFHRLITRAQTGQFSSTDVAEQLCRHIAAGGKIGEPAVTSLDRVAIWISNADPQAASKRALLAAATHEFCLAHPAHFICERQGYGTDSEATSTQTPSPPRDSTAADARPQTQATPAGPQHALEKKLQNARLVGKLSDRDSWELPPVRTLDVRGSRAVGIVTRRMQRRYEQAAAAMDFHSAHIPADTKILVVPSSALWGHGDERGVREPLQRFVERGGSLIVFSQARAADYNAVPVPSGEHLRAYGHDETTNAGTSLWVASKHPITSCLTDPSIDLDRGGYIESWPEGAQVLMRKADGGAAALVTYRVGKGAVAVFCTYEDEAWRDKDPTEEAIRLFSDLFTWAHDPNRPRPTCHTGQQCRSELRWTIRNRTGIPAIAVEFRLWDPLDPDTIIHRWQQPLELPAGAATDLVIQIDLPPELQLRPGIHQVSGRLLGAPPQVPGATEELPLIVIQVEPDVGQITVEGDVPIPTRTPDIAVATAGLGWAGALFNDLPVRVSVRSFSQTAFSGRLVLVGANRTRGTIKPIGEWPVVLEPWGTESRDLTLGKLWTGIAEPTIMWLEADVFDDATGSRVARSRNWLSKRNWAD